MLNVHTFAANLENAVLFAVGNTLVCDELNEAKRLSWSGERHKGGSFCCLLFPATAVFFFLYR